MWDATGLVQARVVTSVNFAHQTAHVLGCSLALELSAQVAVCVSGEAPGLVDARTARRTIMVQTVAPTARPHDAMNSMAFSGSNAILTAVRVSAPMARSQGTLLPLRGYAELARKDGMVPRVIGSATAVGMGRARRSQALAPAMTTTSVGTGLVTPVAVVLRATLGRRA